MNYNRIFQIILLIFIFISKEFIVFNEEVLVLIAFFIFILLIIKFAKSSINDSLDVKLEEIRSEFNFYKNLEKETILYLINFHKKQILLAENIQKIMFFSVRQVKFVELIFKLVQRKQVKLNFEEKLKKLTNYELQKNIYIQTFYLSNLSYIFDQKYRLLKKFFLFNDKIKKVIILNSFRKFKNLK